MSQFLPGNIPKTASDSLQQIIARDPALPLQQDEQQLINRLLGSPSALPSAFWAALIDRVVVDAPSQIPFSQLQGASQFVVKFATPIFTQESTTSVTYTDLATTGPQLTGLSDGRYLVMFGCQVANIGAGEAASMSIDTNGNGAVDADSCVIEPATHATIMRAVSKDLNTGGNNTFTCKYRVNAGTGDFLRRWLVVQRYANL